MNLRFTMAFLVVLRTAAFQAGPRLGQKSKLSASFLDDLTKTFSSMTGGGDASKYYTVGLTGAGGLIGTALQDELSKKRTIKGKPIRLVKLSRGNQAETKSLDEKPISTLVWNPKGASSSEVIDPNVLKEMDALIHLSGENISTGLSGPLAPLGIRPWTPEKKQEILDSRTVTTSALAKAIASSNKKIDFLVASGVGAYGPKFVGAGAVAADESYDISKSEGFLAEVSRQWEAASEPAKKGGNRVVNMRNGVVLSRKGGAMAKLYPIFLVGGGGIVGSGQQYFPYISCRDMARAIVHVLETPKLSGPVNMCAPSGCTNAEFTAAMGKVLGRPTLLPFPGFAVSLLFGEMGEEVLLGGTRAEPKKLLESGFSFNHGTVEEAVQSAVDEEI
mmetsp:Transcript_58645/g.170170  ORF Transcript_58645/g.170170 Transcript_58645/m.170170 type:complete len:389 (+) Transcript_58645:55-1221(+)